MLVYYLESSALLKRYKSEKGSETVNELFGGKKQDELFLTSYLTVLEVSTGNVLQASACVGAHSGAPMG